MSLPSAKKRPNDPVVASTVVNIRRAAAGQPFPSDTSHATLGSVIHSDTAGIAPSDQEKWDTKL
jgi:hypothetical protein